jgi:hypothetical protein
MTQGHGINTLKVINESLSWRLVRLKLQGLFLLHQHFKLPSSKIGPEEEVLNYSSNGYGSGHVSISMGSCYRTYMKNIKIPWTVVFEAMMKNMHVEEAAFMSQVLFYTYMQFLQSLPHPHSVSVCTAGNRVYGEN